jgi:hypothetical protein
MEWSFGDILISMSIFFFWVLFIWMFIGIFADIFRRRDLSGWGKAGWTLLIFVLPLLGILIYMVARPRATAEEMVMGGYGGRAGYSAADEISKLAELHARGALSDEEYMRLRTRAVA